MARMWESIISYESRSGHVTTSRWRLSGVKTIEGSENTDSGMLWLTTSKSGDDLTCELYKDDGLASGDKVCTATAVDVSGCDGTGANSVQVTFAEAESSGLSGEMWVHAWASDDYAPVLVALCTDEDMDGLWDDIENLPNYSATHGCAEFIRMAGDDVIGKVTKRYQDELGGFGAREAWWIADSDRAYPDLRRIANPAQLRSACAHRALAFALGSSHQRAEETMYSAERDYHNAEYAAAIQALVLTTKSGDGDDASDSGRASVIQIQRV